eukprot:55344-Pyramimonas_sp.AAC.1
MRTDPARAKWFLITTDVAALGLGCKRWELRLSIGAGISVAESSLIRSSSAQFCLCRTPPVNVELNLG